MAKWAGSVREDDGRDDEAFDVPAAVLCAFCGQPDCPGCRTASDDESGVLAIIPWERPGSVASRLWSTASATTHGAEAFFATLPTGPISPALRFALLAELLAVTTMMAALLPFAALALPGLALELASNAAARASALRFSAVGVPALTLWMVLAHVAHGIALDAGARRQGARTQRTRALRFGLYACGWDLMAGPLGAAVTLATGGRSRLMELVARSVTVPSKASVAFLQGIYALRPEEVARARQVGAIAAVALAITSGLVVVALALVSF